MKRENGGKLSDQQAYWIHCLRGQGYVVHVCNGYEEARKTIENYLKED